MHTLKRLGQMTLFEFRSLMRNKIAFFFNLVMPIVLVAIFGSMGGTSGTDARSPIGWIDLDRGPVAQRLHDALYRTNQVELITGDEADLKRQLGKGTLRAILILPADLSAKVAAGALPAVAVVRDPSSNSSSVATIALENFVGRFGAEMAGARPALIASPEDLPGMERFVGFDFLIPGQMVYMLLAAGLMSVAIALATKRQNGTLRHLFSTPLPVGAWVTAQVLANLLVTALQVVVLFTAGRTMFGVHAPYNIAGTAAALVIAALTSLSMGLATGALLPSTEAAFPVSMTLFFLLALLGNAMMPMDGAPGFMLALQKFLPSYYMTHALRQIMMQGKGLTAVAGDLAILAACTVAIGGLAVWRIRKQVTRAA